MSTNGQERWEKKALKTTLKKRDESCKHKVKNGSKYVKRGYAVGDVGENTRTRNWLGT